MTDPYYGFVTLKYSDFDIADIVSSTAAKLKFVQGPYSVRIDTNAMDIPKLNSRESIWKLMQNLRANIYIILTRTYL